MRKIFLLISVLFLCFEASMSAQDWESAVQTTDGQKSYTSYLTNQWQDNLYIGAGVGISTRFSTGKYSDIIKSFINPTFEIYALKWITPEIGLRLDISGFNGREGLKQYTPFQVGHSPFPYKEDGSSTYVTTSSKPGTLYYGYFQAAGDVLWNVVNTFRGYKKGSFYTGSIYASVGYLRMFDNKTANKGIGSAYNDQEIAFGLGYYSTFRLAPRLVATADLRFSNFASRYRSNTGVRTTAPALTVGISYNLFKTSWNDVKEVKSSVDEAREAQYEAIAAKKEAEEALAKVRQSNMELAKHVDNLTIEMKTVSYEKIKERAQNAGLVVYFFMGSNEIAFPETYHLSTYVEECLAKDPDHVFYLTGSADKGTGKMEDNLTLSYNRAISVQDFILKNFPVEKENIIISNVVTDKHADGAYDRCVLIENK